MLRRWRIGDPAPSHLNSYQSKTQPYPGERHNQDGKYCHHKIADSVLYIPHLFSLPSKRSRGLPIAIHRQWPKQYQRNAVFRSAPLSRGETTVTGYTSAGILFQSTPLSRGETLGGKWWELDSLFQSTPLSRGETVSSYTYSNAKIFQSTPLSRGETTWLFRYSPSNRNFNPLPSHEGRRAGYLPGRPVYNISIHSPLTRGDGSW